MFGTVYELLVVSDSYLHNRYRIYFLITKKHATYKIPKKDEYPIEMHENEIYIILFFNWKIASMDEDITL